MPGENNENRGDQKYHNCCDGRRWRKKHYKRGLRFGVMLVILGLLWCAAKTGMLPVELTQTFWPVAMIFIGIWISMVSIIKKKKLDYQTKQY